MIVATEAARAVVGLVTRCFIVWSSYTLLTCDSSRGFLVIPAWTQNLLCIVAEDVSLKQVYWTSCVEEPGLEHSRGMFVCSVWSQVPRVLKWTALLKFASFRLRLQLHTLPLFFFLEQGYLIFLIVCGWRQNNDTEFNLFILLLWSCFYEKGDLPCVFNSFCIDANWPLIRAFHLSAFVLISCYFL